MTNSRLTAFNALLKVETSKGFSNIVIDKALSESKLSSRDKVFACALFYGVLERMITLDYIIRSFSKNPIEKMPKKTLTVLRMGIYQLLYMDSVPDNAAVNESVELIKKCNMAKSSGFVNAALRGFIRSDKKLNIRDEKTPEFLSVFYSCPLWLVQKWIHCYGYEITEGILIKSLNKPPLVIRVNTLKITTDELLAVLLEKGIKAKINETIQNSLIISDFGSIEELEEFKNGFFHVQDTASQLCVKALELEKGMTFTDMCSAPGGKSFTAAQYLENSGKIYAFDLYEHKIKLINTGAKRLGIDIIDAQVSDSSVFNKEIEKADRVLCDAPCSGLGIIRRKPEIKYKDKKELNALPNIQKDILKNAANYVKDGGILVYSTCSLNPDENENIAKWFLKEYSNFKPLDLPCDFEPFIRKDRYMATLFPQIMDTDGFFVARFVKDKL